MRLILSAALLLTACSGMQEREVRDALSPMLKDAESAQFRNVERDATGALCGQVNAKNGFGAYTGFRQFYVDDGFARIDSDESDLASRMCAAGGVTQ